MLTNVPKKSFGDVPIAELVQPGRVHRRIYTDAAIYDLEQEAIWRRSWLLVGHISELKKPGDFLTRAMGRQPIILCRDKDDILHVFLNSCRHRGAKLCREKLGNAPRLNCIYHAWSFDFTGKLRSVPEPEGYGPEFRLEDFSLFEARVDTYQGLVFATLDPNPMPLPEFLGNSKEYLDMALSSDMEVFGSQEYQFDGNWKFHMENTLDGLHGSYLHLLFARSGMLTAGHSIDLGNGHGLLEWKTSKAKGDLGKTMGLDATEASPEKNRVMILFPNMALITINDLINLRILSPISVGRSSITALALGKPGDDPELRQRRGLQLSATQGPAGSAGADDIEIYEVNQEGCEATAPGIEWLELSRGLDRQIEKGGLIVGDLNDETAIRGCYVQWREMMRVPS
jgi:phenylpropionate dioxygenase-like ring-hydroxylating dioxygenase large terminal subunit